MVLTRYLSLCHLSTFQVIPLKQFINLASRYRVCCKLQLTVYVIVNCTFIVNCYLSQLTVDIILFIEHFGSQETLQRCSQQFHWRRMHRHVNKYVMQCPHCHVSHQCTNYSWLLYTSVHFSLFIIASKEKLYQCGFTS